MNATFIYHPAYAHLKEYIAWFVAAVVLVAGWKYLRDAIAFVLMKLYELFVLQQNSGS